MTCSPHRQTQPMDESTSMQHGPRCSMERVTGRPSAASKGWRKEREAMDRAQAVEVRPSVPTDEQ